MSMTPRFLARLTTLSRRNRMEHDLAEELQFHLDQEISKNITAGMSSEQALYAALRSFGGVEQIKEECRDIRGMPWLESFWQDTRYGLRMLIKNPGLPLWL
jgi:hypothetical protein